MTVMNRIQDLYKQGCNTLLHQ